jgi:hypothetical protein
MADAAIRRLARRSLERAHQLTHGERHVVVIASMMAMYLSKDSARTCHRRARTATLARSGGSLTLALLPVLRLWRLLYGQQST